MGNIYGGTDQSKQVRKTNNRIKFIAGAAGIGALVVLGLAATLFGSTYIETGNVGIVKHPNGTVTKVGQGWHWTGFTATVQEYPTYTQALILSNKDYEGKPINQQWEVGTADQQSLPVNTSLTWKINPDDATAVYQSIGGQKIDYVDNKIVEPLLKSIVNEVTHKYSYAEIRGAKQADITDEINKRLQGALVQDGIILERFGFTYVGLPQGMEEAQGQLASAELGKQQAQAAQDKAKIENDTKILNATADAHAAEIEAQGIKAKAAVITELTVKDEVAKAWDGKSWPQYLSIGQGGSFPIPMFNTGGKNEQRN